MNPIKPSVPLVLFVLVFLSIMSLLGIKISRTCQDTIQMNGEFKKEEMKEEIKAMTILEEISSIKGSLDEIKDDLNSLQNIMKAAVRVEEIKFIENSNGIDQSSPLSVEEDINTKEEKKNPAQLQIQKSHYTERDRYQEQYTTIKEHLDNQGDDLKRLLSFGSSIGMEAITLANMYFTDPKYSIFGVDIDEETLDQARKNIANEVEPIHGKEKVTFFNGEDTKIGEYGPYDAIFANSVFCVNPVPKGGAKEILEKFSFSDFDSSISYLDENLKVGGILGIVNTHYLFSDSTVYKKYKPLSVKCPNFVQKISYKEGKKIGFTTMDEEEEGAVFQRDSITLRPCVWVKISA